MRLCAAPFLLLLAWMGLATAFLWLLFLCLASDAVDGFIARRLHQESELGARFDSWSDFAIYVSMPICGWWLWPELIREQAVYVGMVMASLGLPTLVGLLKFHRTTSYHTWGAKLSALTVGGSALLMFAGGPVLPFQLAAFIAAAAALEQVAISLLLNKAESDLPSLWHLLRRQRAG